MKIRQLSIFLENRPGRLARALRILAQAGCDLRAATLVDSSEFGLLRLITPDPAKAERALAAAGFASAASEVLAVEVPDRAGGLAGVLDAVDAAGLNLEYCYAFSERKGEAACVLFRFGDPDAAIAALGRAGIRVLDPVALLG